MIVMKIFMIGLNAEQGERIYMKYSVYVRNQKEGPSCYYRVIQYLNKMDKDLQKKVMVHNIMSLSMFRANMYCKNPYFKKLLQVVLYLFMFLRMIYYVRQDLQRGVDVVVVSRETLPRYMPLYLKMLLEKLYQNTIVIWDFDDDIFYSGEISKREAVLLKKYSKHILVTGDYLKHLLSKEEQKKVQILPTTDGAFQKDNKLELLKKRERLFQKEVRLVWIGTASSIKNLESIVKNLDEFAKQMEQKHKKTSLIVVCNQKLEAECSFLKIRNIPWTRQGAEQAIRNAHIGVMPLLKNKFNLGKGGFKLIQYMAGGLPVVASSVGYNQQVVNEAYGYLVTSDNEWKEALTKLVISEEVWKQKAYAAYKAWEDLFSFQKNYKIWQKLLIGQFQQKIKYSIVIVNWNSGEQLKSCLNSMINLVEKNYQIKKVVIVDNASKDSSVNFDRTHYPFPCELIQNKKNMGFAYACNQGSKQCGIKFKDDRKMVKVDLIKNSYEDIEYLLFLNPDTMLKLDTLYKLSQYLLRKPNDIGIVGIQLFDEFQHISKTCSHFPNKVRRLCKVLGITKLIPSTDIVMSEWDHKASRQVDQVMGAFFVISKQLFEYLNGFDERFFVYYEEVDLSKRAKDIGYHSYFFSGAQAFHKGGGTSEQVLDKRLFYILNSYLKYEKKHNGLIGFIFGCGLVGVEYFARIGLLLVKRKKGNIKYLNNAYRELLLELLKK